MPVLSDKCVAVLCDVVTGEVVRLKDDGTQEAAMVYLRDAVRESGGVLRGFLAPRRALPLLEHQLARTLPYRVVWGRRYRWVEAEAGGRLETFDEIGRHWFTSSYSAHVAAARRGEPLAELRPPDRPCAAALVDAFGTVAP